MNHAATSRELLLETAKKIAYGEGLSQISIRRAASESGVAIGTVYNYFPAKSDLIVAVLEDFWKSVFHERIPGYPHEPMGFIELYEQLFNELLSNLGRFRSGFLKELSHFDDETREKGKRVEGEYWKHIQEGMLSALQKDATISPAVWTEKFTQQDFLEFAYFNLVMLLQRENPDCSSILEVLRRVLAAG